MQNTIIHIHHKPQQSLLAKYNVTVYNYSGQLYVKDLLVRGSKRKIIATDHTLLIP